MISDRGPQFISQFWKEFLKLLKTKQALTAPYHPEANALTKRFNRTFQEGLRSFVNGLQDDWEDCLILFEFAYNDSEHPSTGSTLFYLNYGKHPRTPTTVGLNSSNNPAAAAFVEHMHSTLAAARDCILKAAAVYSEAQVTNFQNHTLKRVILYSSKPKIMT